MLLFIPDILAIVVLVPELLRNDSDPFLTKWDDSCPFLKATAHTPG